MNIWKKIRLPLALLVLGITVVILIAMSKPDMQGGNQAPQAAAKVQVRVHPLSHGTTALAVNANGTISPRREIDIVAQVSGQIIRVEPAFANGAAFKNHQLLLQIDDRDYQIALTRAKAELAQAERHLAEERGRHRHAKQEWRNLGDDLANALFLREPQLAEALAALEAANANVNKAELDIARSKISVPFKGRIKETFVNLGQYVSIGLPLARIYDSSAVELRLPLSDNDIALLDLPLLNKTGGSDINLAPVTIYGTVAGSHTQWQGKIVRTDAFVDSKTRSYYAIAEVENPFGEHQPAALLPGMFVSAEIQGKEIENVAVLPRSALVNLDKIYVLDAENRVAINTVEVLRKTAESVWLRCDLPDNTLVVLDKQSLIRNGIIVEPISEPSSGSDTAEIPPSEAALTSEIQHPQKDS